MFCPPLLVAHVSKCSANRMRNSLTGDLFFSSAPELSTTSLESDLEKHGEASKLIDTSCHGNPRASFMFRVLFHFSPYFSGLKKLKTCIFPMGWEGVQWQFVKIPSRKIPPKNNQESFLDSVSKKKLVHGK